MFFVAQPAVFVAPSPPISRAYLTGRFVSTSAAERSFDSVSIGNFADQIIACVIGWNYIGSLEMASAKIDGVDAPIVRQGNGTLCGLALFWRKCGSDDPVTIEASFPAAVFNVTLGIYRLRHQTEDAPAVSAVGTGGGTAVRGVTIDAPASCAMIGGAVNTGVDPDDGTFTGIDEDAELGSAASFRGWVGSRLVTDAEDALTISHSACRQILMAGWI